MLGTRTLGEILADREKIASEMQVNGFFLKIGDDHSEVYYDVTRANRNDTAADADDVDAADDDDADKDGENSK